MLAIGRALMAKPRLVFMDEPSLGLAPLIIRDLAKIIRGINQGGISILLAEQNARLGLLIFLIGGFVMQTGRIVLGRGNEYVCSIMRK